MSFAVSILGARLAHTDLRLERSRRCHGELEFAARVAPGVTVTWDPATPRQCVAFSVHPDTGGSAAGVGSTDPRDSGVTDRSPWLRLAAVGMFDRHLHLPLDRPLLDAEIAAAQVGAARTLSPAEPIRDELVDRALVRARRAARGMVRYLDRLAEADLRPPTALLAALDIVTGCYTTLCAYVTDYDAALVSVTEAADRLALVKPASARGRPRAPEPVSPVSGAAQIYPRFVPARALRLGPTADSAEIDVVPVGLADRRAIRVQVPAFEARPDPVETPDVGLRVIDRGSGHVHAYGLLGLRDRCFEAVVSLPDAVAADDVRVELYDADDAAPPVSSDDRALWRVRRATLFLAGWRGLVADVRLWGAAAKPADRLRTVIRTLAPDRDTDGPLWAGGPAVSHLGRIVELGDRKLAALLRAGAPAATIPGDDGGAAAVLGSVAGPGDLLAAELAAAYERAVPA